MIESNGSTAAVCLFQKVNFFDVVIRFIFDVYVDLQVVVFVKALVISI